MLKEFTREDQSDFAPTKYDIVPLLLNGIAVSYTHLRAHET